MDPDPKRRQTAIIIIAILFIASCITAIVLAVYENTKNPYEQYIEISNLKDFTAGKPTDRSTVFYIQHALFNTINTNLDHPLKQDEVKDALVRADSFTQTYSDSTKIHAVHFIVDIKSLKQSYDVKYEWASSKNAQDLAEYGTLVSCLPVEKLIYGDFNCKDMMSKEDEAIDPIMDHLPASSLNYEITAGNLVNGKLSLNAKIMLSAADERIDPDGAIEMYKTEVSNWITSVNLNPNDYTINYEIIRSSLY